VNQGRVLLSAILLASACVDITVNTQNAPANTAVCNPGGTREAGDAAPDGNSYQPPKPTDTLGRLISNVTESQGFYPTAAMAPQVLAFNFGTGTDTGGSGLDGLTQYAATSTITFLVQSGTPAIPLP
jgi:hypothetical protein